MTATLAAGLTGVQMKVPLAPGRKGPKEADSTFRKLPTELHESLAALRADTDFAVMLGKGFVKVYKTVKTAEINRLRDEISAAGAEYFDLY